MAKDRIVKPFLYVSKDQYRIDNIEDMKGVNFALGDVVDLLGYYEAGDGAHHKRKIESADDGSGVRLANGLWANIVHNGEVDASWFGAKGDGITDDSVVIQKAIDWAFSKRILLTGGFRDFKVSKTIQLKYNTKNMTITYTGVDTAVEVREYIWGENKIVENLTIRPTNSAKIGFDVMRTEFVFRNVKVYGFEIGINVGTYSCYFYSCVSVGNKINVSLYRSLFKTGIYTEYNSLIFHGCEFSSSSTGVGALIGDYNQFDSVDDEMYGVNIKFDGCNFDGCSVIINFAYNVSFENCYFELTTRSENACFLIGDTDLKDKFKIGDVRNLSIRNCFSHRVDNFIIDRTNRLDLEVSNCMFSGKILYHNPSEVKIESRKFKFFGTPGKIFFNSGYSSYFSTNLNNITKDNLTNNIYYQGSFAENRVYPNHVRLGSYVRNETASDAIRLNKFLNPKKISIRNLGGLVYTFVDEKEFSEIEYLDGYDSDSGIVFLYDVDFVKKTFRLTTMNSNLTELTQLSFTQTTNIKSLNTPYYTTKMQQEGIYEDFISYMDEQHEYERLQRELEEQRQLEFESREDKEQSYEDWLSTQPQLMPFVEPQPSQVLLDFKKKYLG